MKTNPAARYFVKIRPLLLCASLAAIVGFVFCFGASFTAQIGQTTVIQSDGPQAPNMSISDLMAAAR